jgi:hypothetical protein
MWKRKSDMPFEYYGTDPDVSWWKDIEWFKDLPKDTFFALSICHRRTTSIWIP